MKKVRYVVGLAGIVPAAAGFMAPAAAHAATTPRETAVQDASATAKTVNLTHIARPDITAGSVSTSIDANSVYLNKRSGGKALMYSGDWVKVSCYYRGTGASGTGLPDPYWDHVIYESSLNGVFGPFHDIGHVADSYVNFGGVYPSKVGIPKCK
jgi:hypothetical protein